ncbi:cytochrome c [Flavobacterium sp. GT3R68]|uniref:cytochrome c n=1 Tax=Flavobacterium sp. GT3R68 TaxID=2594437 RepID=UPI000F86622C|nr:c-type cytochrome [Flavobacterium sp. GT3R68]RTY95303.1 cytochrome c [Flavobacterium sp. GSN2]TRW90956.1 cytochrome c [Flavobacterium sp. GT3R68]
MKTKIIGTLALGAIIYSCAPKAVVQTTPAPVKDVALSEELAQGKSLYESNCARCHKLFEPSSHTKEEWKPIVTRMQKKSKIDDVQTASIYNYVTYAL